MDVVPPGKIRWQYDPFSADEVDRKIYGRGDCRRHERRAHSPGLCHVGIEGRRR
ncbi:MAG: hypothetical protein C7B43_10980 [Sulfobacillus benefaciens]|uniref:Uncharacterized protein n=1 Tax=Sulfobacillus benefaciens TaxID=453960 RepID=A0A2T2X085_9FIRM|nr:MAG: hypothetical protein C7B43_10980 [Sulfobacillus benefaciens]